MNPHTTKHREQKNFDDKKKTAKSVPTYTHIAYVSFKES